MRARSARRSSVWWFVLIQSCLLPEIEVDEALDRASGGTMGVGGFAAAGASPRAGGAAGAAGDAGGETASAAGDGGAAATAGSSGDGGGVASVAGSGGAGGMDGGASGAAGAGARPCDPAFPQDPLAGLDACPDGHGCAPDGDGESACFEQPGEGAWAVPCSETESDCAPGRFCDAELGYCRPYCLSDSECQAVRPFRCAPFDELGRETLRAAEHEVGVCEACIEECAGSDNGECEDGGPGSVSAACAFGTDCIDCGPR